MKHKAVFFGVDCQIGKQTYKTFGQEATFDSREDFAQAVIGGGAFLPVDTFKALNFTPEELKNRRARRSDAFQKKMHLAIEQLAKLRAELSKPAAVVAQEPSNAATITGGHEPTRKK